MASIADLKEQYPDLSGKSDDEVVDAVHQAFYPDLPREDIAKRLGVKPQAAPAEKSSALRRYVADPALSLVQGAVGVPQAAVGLADIATGGQVGKALENEGGVIGFRPNEATDYLQSLKTPEQQAADKAVSDAGDGEGDLLDKTGRVIKAAAQNPSVIPHAVLQSLPAMGAGGVVGRGALALAPRLGVLAGGVGEGVTTIGQQAEQIRTDAHNPSGLLTPAQSALAVGSGAVTGLIGAYSGKLAQKMGFENAENLLVGIHADPVAQRGVVKQMLGAAVTEGFLEELPQSVQEQVAQNVATGQPLDAGVASQAVLGVMSGAAMGAGAHGMFHRQHVDATTGAEVKSAGDTIREELQPGGGPLANAVNAGIENAADQADAAMPLTVDQAPQSPRAANADMIAAIRRLPADQQEDALHLQALGNRMDVAPGVRRHAQNRLDVLLGPITPAEDPTAPQAEPAGPVAAPGKPGDELDQTLAAAEQSHRDADAAASTEASGAPLEPAAEPDAGPPTSSSAAPAEEAAPPEPAPQAMTPEEAQAQRERDRPAESTGQPINGDILNSRDMPFRSMGAAMRALGASGGETTHDIVRVADGLVVRPKPKEQTDELGSTADTGSDVERATAAPADAGGATSVAGLRGSDGEVSRPVASTVESAPAVEQPGSDGGAAADALKPASSVDHAGETVAAPAGNAAPSTMPALHAQWQEAVKRGDAAEAQRINDTIVAEKAARKALAEVAPAVESTPAAQPKAEAAPAHPNARTRAVSANAAEIANPTEKAIDRRKRLKAGSAVAASEPAKRETGATTQQQSVRLQPAAGHKEIVLPRATNYTSNHEDLNRTDPDGSSSSRRDAPGEATAGAARSEGAVRHDGSEPRGRQLDDAGAENRPELVRPEGRSELDGLDVKVRAVVERRSTNSVASAEEGRQRQRDGALVQKPERKGLCFRLAAEASSHGLGNMVIGLDSEAQWHAVVSRDGAIYDPTFGQWFEPGVYESLGFKASKTLTGDEVRAFIKQSGGFAPDARNQGLTDAPAASRSPADGLRAKVAAAAGVPLEASAQRVERVQSLVDRITARWANAPKVVVLSGIDDPATPERLRTTDAGQRSQDAQGDPEGFFDGDTVYLMADQLHGDADVLRVLMHESLGHFGLRGVFGKELGTILDRMTILQAGKVRDKAKQYGLDFEKQADRRAAAEEVLAELAQRDPQLGWVQHAIAAIRTWLRENIPGYKSMRLSDAEIVRNYIEPARNFVRNGDGLVQPRASAAAPASGPAPRGAFSRGTFDAARTTVADWKMPAGYKFGDWIGKDVHDGKLSWWQKSVGTPFHLAQKNAYFRPVYDGIQNFIGDISRYANAAADLAPTLLPKLDAIGDVIKAQPPAAADTKAFSKAIFDGTLRYTRDSDGNLVAAKAASDAAAGVSTFDKAQRLFKDGHVSEAELKRWQATPLDIYDGAVNNRFQDNYLKPGVVFTDAELRQVFKLTDKQIGMYREALRASNRSLDDTMKSGLVSVLGQDATPESRQSILANEDADAAAIATRDFLYQLAEQNPGRAEALNIKADSAVDMADRLKSLKEKGYFPLSRFGTMTLDVVGPDGTREWYGHFEDAADRAKMARQMRGLFPDATITQGTVSQEAFRQFAGVTPETAELFGEFLGLGSTGNSESDAAFQAWIAKSKSTRSAMQRLQHRKGIEGFSEDATRTLAGFVISNARHASSNLHMDGISRAKTAIPKEQGELRDYAERMSAYVGSPTDEATWLRGVIFAQQLAGSVAGALINATQSFTTTLPRLTMDHGVAASGRALANALKLAAQDASKTTGDKALDAALKEHEDVIRPQEIHQLMGAASERGSLLSGDGTAVGDARAKAINGYRRFNLVLGKTFSIAEQFNRRMAFIAAYRLAVGKGRENPGAYAANITAETQFSYNKGNKPVIGRTPAGAIAFTFKQYTVQYLEMMQRMWTMGGADGKKATLLAVAIIAMLSGADGLPFADNVDDIIDGVLSHLGYNFQSKRAKHEFLASQLGDHVAAVFEHGLSALPGVPLDVAGRFSVGKVIPGLGLLVKKADHSSDVAELAGPVADLGKRALTAAGQVIEGHPLDALTTMQAVWARNLTKGVQMWDQDAYLDAKGNKVISTNGLEAVLKAIGFQPQSVARIQEASSEVFEETQFVTLMKGEMQAQLAKAIASNDSESKAEVRALRDQWNSRNPEAKITLNMPAALRKARQMNQSKADRMASTAPKAMRAEVKARLAEAAQ